jgi:hypothetical protein
MSVNRTLLSMRSPGSGARARPTTPLEVDRGDRLVTDDPRIVPGSDVHDLAGDDVVGLAVAHEHAHAARKDVHRVVKLAPLGANDRLHVLRPAPARLRHLVADRHRPHGHDLDSTALEGHRLVRLLERLGLDGHGRSVGSGRASVNAC